jgi:hypothetical protein
LLWVVECSIPGSPILFAHGLALHRNQQLSRGRFILRHPTTHGLQMAFSYAFAKSMDIGSHAERTNSQGTTSITSSGLGPGNTTRSFIANPWYLRLEHAPSDFYIRHAITIAWVYQLPFGRGKLLVKPALDGMLSPEDGNCQVWGAGRAPCRSAWSTPGASQTARSGLLRQNVGGVLTHIMTTSFLPGLYQRWPRLLSNQKLSFSWRT